MNLTRDWPSLFRFRHADTVRLPTCEGSRTAWSLPRSHQLNFGDRMFDKKLLNLNNIN